MPTPLEVLKLLDSLKQKKEELSNQPQSSEYYKARVINEARRKMNTLALAHAFGQSHDLMAPLSKEEIIKMNWAKYNASPENMLLKNVPSNKRVLRKIQN